jgi:MHS family proline/betaine transporter-like MFS transporter
MRIARPACHVAVVRRGDNMNTANREESPPPPAQDPRRMHRVIVASVIGNAFERFDFMAYVYFSKIIAAVFFSVGNSVVSMSLALATFASGFLVRPIGGVLLGMYADRVGRTHALSLVMLIMCAGTLLLGLAPGYATLGLAAPLLVLLARLIQGLAIGGQFSLLSVIIGGTAPTDKKMFCGSFNMSSQALAVLLSSGCSHLLTNRLSSAARMNWGWRVPFLIGALVGPLGFYIRHHIVEPPEFEAVRKQVRSGVARVFRLRNFVREQGDAALCAMSVMIIGTASNYLWNAYLPVYVERQLHLPLKSALLGTFVGG